MNQRPCVIHCDDDGLYSASLAARCASDFDVVTVESLEGVKEALAERVCHSLVLDLRLGGGGDGLVILQAVQRSHPRLPVIVHSALSAPSTIVHAMRLGAADYVPKCADSASLLKTLHQQIALASRPRPSVPAHGKLIGESQALAMTVKLVERFRRFPGNVLITGESGVGKEYLARRLAQEGAPFVAVDSATLTGGTADSALFGHERGAFTGAAGSRRGLFEEADGGVLFLDELGNCDLELQAKLRRVLQEKQLRRLGGNRLHRVDVRVVAATNRDLSEMAACGTFRHDLYMRLAVLTVEVPPLRHRREDIPSLVEHFLASLVPAEVKPLSSPIMGAFFAYAWPGNVRELANVVQYLMAVAGDRTPTLDDLPAKMRSHRQEVGFPYEPLLAPTAGPREENEGDYRSRMRAFEARLLRHEYQAAEGHVPTMSARLGLNRSHLYDKLRVHNIFTRSRNKGGKQA